MDKPWSALFFFALLLSSCLGVDRFEQTRPMFGTTVTVTVLHHDAAAAEDALDAAFDEMARVERIFSIYETMSEASILNREGGLDKATAEFRAVLDRSLYFSEKSGGAFDPTVQPLLDLYTESFGIRHRPPADEEIAEAKQLTGYEKIKVHGDSVAIGTGMSLTFGGIAKGYAADRAARVLREHGVTQALIVAGGQVQMIGAKEGGQPWEVALRNPRNASESVTTIYANDVSVSTSGDYERYFDPDLSAHHIMDPRTGKSATELISVTVVAREGMNADALSTAVFVLGPVEGMALLERFSDAEGLLITKDREVLRTTGFSRFERAER